jgi:hypothetical protein
MPDSWIQENIVKVSERLIEAWQTADSNLPDYAKRYDSDVAWKLQEALDLLYHELGRRAKKAVVT